MANTFDRFPVDDAVLKTGTLFLSAEWASAFEFFWENLSAFMNENGFFLPNLTAAQIAALQNPQNGQLLYNVTVDAPQFYQTSSKSWRTISFT